FLAIHWETGQIALLIFKIIVQKALTGFDCAQPAFPANIPCPQSEGTLILKINKAICPVSQCMARNLANQAVYCTAYMKAIDGFNQFN
ncbi:MAG: hypothetical protein AAFU84_14345, partial [Cyanobacteria bacterium J06633_23]